MFLDNVLVVGIVEGVSLSESPNILEKRHLRVHPTQGMSSHDGHSLPASEAKLFMEKVQCLITITSQIGMVFMPVCLELFPFSIIF